MIYVDIVHYILHVIIFHILILWENGDYKQVATYILFSCIFL